MMHLLLEVVIPERGGHPSVNARMQLMYALEILFGLRVGEALAGGDYHGLLANNLYLLRRLDAMSLPTGRVTGEAYLEHSKTGHSRYINAVGLSLGPARVRFEDFTRNYWELVGFEIRTRHEAGYEITGPDYYVVRVSLVALTRTGEGDVERLEHLARVLRISESREARKWAEYSLLRAKQRLSGDSLDKKYINVVGGARDSADVCQVARELHLAGFEEHTSVVPGPLMRATHGKDMGFTHMPLQPSSTYDMLHECLPRAFELANRDSPDPELDLRGLAEPLWGHHSNRRGADTVTRHTMHLTGATERDIDMIFGWNEHLARAV